MATSSGMAAILSSCLALLKAGDHIVCSRSVFGTTTVVFTRYLAKFGIETTFVTSTDYAEWQQATRPATKFFFLETPSNPLSEVVDIRKVADIAHAANAILAVDNCFCTPALQRPLDFGADLIINSATKYLDGQGRCLGGVVAGSSKLVNEVLTFIRSAGPTMSPFNAWVFLKGLETLKLRMDAHSAAALTIARCLRKSFRFWGP